MLAFQGRQAARQKLAHLPPLVLPDGQRQERSLAVAGLLAWLGDELLTAVTAGAQQHLQAGGEGRWREYVARLTE